MKETKIIGQELTGKRLDQATRYCWPQFSLRAARRLIADGSVRLNGKKAAPGAKLGEGDEVLLDFQENPQGQRAPEATLLAAQGDFCFFYKPPGMHSEALAGRQNRSLEKLAPAILAAKRLPESIVLLQRLDFGTGGIIAAAFNAESARRYREMEKAGTCAKYYYAILSGRLENNTWAKNALDCSHGKRVHRLDMEADPLRWTFFQPLACADGKTLALCKIKWGQRHQIRAHAAALGLPLAGDPLYGAGNGQNFHLAHFRLEFPGHAVEYLDPYSPIRQMFYNTFARMELKCM